MHAPWLWGPQLGAMPHKRLTWGNRLQPTTSQTRCPESARPTSRLTSNSRCKALAVAWFPDGLAKIFTATGTSSSVSDAVLGIVETRHSGGTRRHVALHTA